MADLKTAAWMVRYGARSLAHNLEFIPEERATWKPTPESKSALDIAAEVVRGMNMYRPIFSGPEYPATLPRVTPPQTLAEARSQILAIAEEYAVLLEAAGPELDRPQAMPFGGVFQASRAVCFPLMDLFHHHGQVVYLQTLLGDAETHWCDAAIEAEFFWKDEEG